MLSALKPMPHSINPEDLKERFKQLKTFIEQSKARASEPQVASGIRMAEIQMSTIRKVLDEQTKNTAID